MNDYAESDTSPSTDVLERIRVIQFYGIGVPMAGYTLKEAVKLALDDPYKDINVLIHSFGGDAYEAIAVVDALMVAKGLLKGGAQLRGIVHGYAMSAATFILQFCDTRAATSHSLVMVHGIHADGVAGSQGKIDQTQRSMRMLSDIYRDAYLRRGLDKKTKAQWTKLLKEDTGAYLKAEEALEWGLLDEVLPVGDVQVRHTGGWS